MDLLPSQERKFKRLMKEIVTPNLKSNVLIVEGQGGCGKSEILKKIHKNKNLIAYYFDNSKSINNYTLKDNAKNINTLILRTGTSNLLGWIISYTLIILVLIPILIELFRKISHFLCIICYRKRRFKSIEELANTQTSTSFLKQLYKTLIIRKSYHLLLTQYFKILNKFKNNKNTNNLYKNILIFDEINFYSVENINIIKELLFNNKLKDEFKIFSSTQIILSFCPQYNVSEQLQELYNNIRKGNIFSIKRYNKKDIIFLCKTEPETLIKSVLINLNRIKSISLQSNLALVISIISYIRNHLDISNYNLNKSDLDIVFNKYFESEKSLKSLLAALSVTDNNELLLEECLQISKCAPALPDERKFIKKEIFKAIEKKLLTPQKFNISDNERTRLIQFRDPKLKNYFKPKDKNVINEFFMQYANVLKIISPGDYIERADTYRKIQNSNMANIFETLDFVQKCYKDTIEEVEYNISENDCYYSFKKCIQSAYNSYYRGSISDVSKMIGEMNIMPLPDLLKFEKDYLRCKILLFTIDVNTLEEIKTLLEEYQINIDMDEKEIHIRIKLILCICELYLGKNEQVASYVSDIINDISLLSKVDGKYNYHMYSILRRNLISNNIVSAYKDTEKAVTYFSKKASNTSSLFFIKEYFYSLINHSSNCRFMHEYDDAYKFALKAYIIYCRQPQYFCKVTLYNLLALTLFENQKKSSQGVLSRYLLKLSHSIDSHLSLENTDYFILNNIACFYAYSNNLDKATEYIDNAFRIINRANNKIGNHLYCLSTNQAVFMYLKGNHDAALCLLNSVKNVHTFNFSKVFHHSRHDILNEIFASKDTINSVEKLDKVIASKYQHPSHPSTNQKIAQHFNKSLYFMCLQYWSC